MAAKSASGTMTPTSPETSQHTADLLRMTRESMNGSFTAKLFNAAGTQRRLSRDYSGTVPELLPLASSLM